MRAYSRTSATDGALISRHGRYLPMTSSGYLVNDTDRQYVKAKLARRLIAAYEAHFAGSLCAVYVRGSLARGTNVVGGSDVDAVGISRVPIAIKQLPNSDALSDQLVREFPDFLEASFETASLDKFSNHDHPLPFVIQTQGCCIYGTPLRLAPYRIGPGIMHEARSLKHRLAGYVTEIPKARQEQLRKNCRTLMKATVRAANEIVLLRTQRYTRDLFYCYRDFVLHYPEREPGIRQALSWALSPTDNADQVLAFWADFGDWLSARIDEMELA